MKYTLSILLFLFSTASAMAQIQVYENDSTGVIVHADPRLAVITDYFKTRVPKSRSNNSSSSNKAGSIRSARGFRVQIYNGNDRKRATELKVDFMRKYPSVRTYMTYIQPQFRVKVGDFA